MRKISVIFALTIIALFSVAIVTNLSYGLRNVDFTGFVTLDDGSLSLPAYDGEICTDSDNGRAYLKGETAVYNSIAVDYCLDDTRLVEYSCETLFRTKNIYICPYGCSEGACI